jgi:hypothetical protein
MREPPEPCASAAPNAIELARSVVGRLNAEKAGEQEVPEYADRVQATAQGGELRCEYDAEAGWWSVGARAAAEPTRCEAKLTRQGHGRWRLWLTRSSYAPGTLIRPCAIAAEFVQSVRGGDHTPETLAEDLAARTGAHISLDEGRLTVIAPDGRRCRGLVAAGFDGKATLFVLDGDAWAGGASPVTVPSGRAKGQE